MRESELREADGNVQAHQIAQAHQIYDECEFRPTSERAMELLKRFVYRSLRD
jgi:hypothetical protein